MSDDLKKLRLKQLGMAIRTVRLSRSLSQEQLAMESDLDRTFVSRLERGLANPTYISLIALSTALRVPVSKLFESDSNTKLQNKTS